MERKNDRLPIFTERFRELQGERSNTEFADFLGISRQTVGFYCNGDRVPDALTLVKISRKCMVSADWLLGISNAKSLDIDIQDICKKTGLSENIVKYLLNNQGYLQEDKLAKFAPIKNFNRLFSPDDFHGFLAMLCMFFSDIDAIKEIRDQAEDELLAAKETHDEDYLLLCCDKWFREISGAYKEYRYSRFEIIDFFTEIINDLEKGEDVQWNVEAIKELCMKIDNGDYYQKLK